MKFHTRFNVAPIKNADKVYDRHDNVNRISYVDSTLMVKRFIAEGRDLATARAAALRSGQYSGDMKEIENDDGIILPVYKQDPAIVQPIIDAAKSKLNSSIAEAERKRSESAAEANAEFTENHSDVNRNGDS